LDAPQLDWTTDHPAVVIQRFREGHFRRVQLIR
jgi:hypothetical protein